MKKSFNSNLEGEEWLSMKMTKKEIESFYETIDVKKEYPVFSPENKSKQWHEYYKKCSNQSIPDCKSYGIWSEEFDRKFIK